MIFSTGQKNSGGFGREIFFELFKNSGGFGQKHKRKLWKIGGNSENSGNSGNSGEIMATNSKVARIPPEFSISNLQN